MFTQKKRSWRKGNSMIRPRVTQLVPKRKVLCFLLDSTASRKMPPKATLAPRLWHRVSSTTSQTRAPGTKVASSWTRRTRQTSSQFQAAELKRRNAWLWSCSAERPVVSQTRLMVRRPRQTTQAATRAEKVEKGSQRKQTQKGPSRARKLGVS